jgi:hypothetical protein
MNRRSCVVAATLCAAIALVSSGQEPSERQAFFGDLHIHTNFSFDAFTGNVRTTPDDAYLYAKGHPIAHPSGDAIRITGRPLDFLMVADHAEFLGVHAALLDPTSPTYGHPETDSVLPKPGATLVSAIRQMRELIASGDEIAGDEVIADAWNKTVEAAERHNDPGTFTTFIGFEYTPTPDGRHLHRNVVFRGSEVPNLPFSSRNSENPEDLWTWLDALRDGGIDAWAIPHTMNQSDGLAFQEQTFGGEPIDRDWVEKRIRNEPIAEISQQKGTSETHPSLSPNDEWADFQIVQYYRNRAENKDPISVFKGGYYRDALRTGLEFEEKLGANPYQLGVVAASDSHTSASAYEEDNYFSTASSAAGRGSVYPEGADGWEGYFTPRQATHGTGGLTGVWAEENTRAAIYDAMRRKESFGTSGPRILVRLFGGFGLDEALLGSTDPVAEAYRSGVSMGGLLTAKTSGSPSFLVWAMRDFETGWLQRAQVIKGWIEGGESHERVYDVACSDGLEPDPTTHRCPSNDARVNLADCSVSRDKGAVELQTVWTDPDFDASQRAFYYVRVLENPSCRWSMWDAVRSGIEPNPDLPKTHQERAWSSPIWYRPE